MTIDRILLANDDANRTKNEFGYLNVKKSNISIAAVNAYRGSEIPNFEALNLDPDRLYFLLRDPAELLKAIETFNMLPILTKHVPILKADPPKELLVGTTGSDAKFLQPYVENSLQIWDGVAITGIENREQYELSSSYAYTAIMTPGIYEGVPYDGVMTEIVGNHVALVKKGRAGPTVVVGDSEIKPSLRGNKMKLTAKAAAVRAALNAMLKPRLAQDAALPNLTPLLLGVGKGNFAEKKPVIEAGIKKAFKGVKLAKDAGLDDIMDMLDSLDGDGDDELADDDDDVASDSSPSDLLTKLLGGLGLDPQVLQQATDLIGKLGQDAGAITAAPAPAPAAAVKALNAGPGAAPPVNSVSKPAMDAAIAAAVAKTESATISRMRDIQTAEAEVFPITGKLVVAMDSAEAVYGQALKVAKIDTNGVHPSAFRTLVQMHLQARSGPQHNDVVIAMDSASVSDFAKRFPGAHVGRPRKTA